MRVLVNGDARELEEGATAEELVRALGLRAEVVAVERNGALVRRADLGATRLEEGDRLEVVTLVGGG